MAALNTTGSASLLIEIVRKVVEDGIEKKDVTFSRIEKDTEAQNTNSLGVRLPVMVEDNASEEWRSTEGADFAPTDAEVYKNLSITYTRVYKSAEFTADVAQLDKQPEKIAPIIAGSVAKATAKLKKSLNRMVFGAGDGEIARYSSGTGTTSIVFTSTSGNYFGSTKLDKRARIQFYDSTLATARNGGQVFTVASKTNATSTAVLDAAPTLSANDVAVFANSVSASINGFGNIIASSGNIHGLSRTTYPALNCATVAAGGAALSASLLDQLGNTMAFKTGMEKQEGCVMIWSPTQRQAYLNLGYELKQFTGEKLDLGFDGISHSNINIVTDVDCPDDSRVHGQLLAVQALPASPRRPGHGPRLRRDAVPAQRQFRARSC
jgi:hypothetical protein